MINTKWLLFILALLLALYFLQQRLWWHSGGIHEMQKLQLALKQQTEKTAALKQQNDALLDEVVRLQQSQDAIEARARSELGMVKKGETFYQIVK